ncbi:hydrogenase assembly chaperone HypC/HupF [Archaeoglobus sulfaticallidus PM70-1]|uniref:Hydrogenase assembly chaperone HypC/HupF n=1 Tax=Archaeoglobus sulfaticallidus PM70-1 TaxID=387631 RepID=N0B9L0_9EURY|nr:HypC/HybG/HupF family hydrogenase formation chaperone [Archaeoglobus sulfaticallidus]AGK60289.1 hydrogenase assembly chaperone HypC/HupF [Archaeoglobus sulfaticallidus PM70-1]
MCLAIPAEVEEVNFPIAIVNFGGTRKEVRIDLLPDVRVGDYVLVHVGYAIQKVDVKEVEELAAIYQKLQEEGIL